MSRRSAADTTPAGLRRSRVQEFSALAGVTIKALRHYDRLGLLTPARTAAGHRLYSARDLERLRRILALKRIGIPLTQMRTLLDADRATLLARLAASREVIARERERLRHADRAIALVEESLRHAPGDRSGLSRLADVIEMRRETDHMKRYFNDDVWDVARRFYENWPDEQWIGLYREIAAAIDDAPGSARGESLLRRWNVLALSLWREFTPDPIRSRQLHEGFARAWRDREHWP